MKDHRDEADAAVFFLRVARLEKGIVSKLILRIQVHVEDDARLVVRANIREPLLLAFGVDSLSRESSQDPPPPVLLTRLDIHDSAWYKEG